MFARRNFVHQRQNGADHQALAALLSPALSTANTVNSASAALLSPSVSSADPSSTDPAPTSAAPSTRTPDSSSPSASSASAATSSSVSASASSNSAASSTSASASALSSSSSVVHTVASAAPTSVVDAPVTTTHAPAVVSQDPSSDAFTATSTSLSSPTATAHPSGGPSTALIVGGVAGALIGLALLGFLLTWCLRRQRNADEDDFDANAFKRQSAILVDDPVEPPRSYNRPQTMIENHNVSPALAAQAGYGGQNFYGSYDGYGQQQPHPETIQPAVSAPQTYGAAPMGYPAYNDPSQQQLSRQPSNAAFLARQPSAAAGYAPPPVPPASFDSGAHYIDLNRSSVSPYQAAQYADISRHLGTSDPNGVAPRESLAIPDDPLPSPFDDPVQPSGPNAVSHVDVDPFRAAPVTAASTPQIYGNTAELHRPDTIYEEGDAYGGI